MLLESPNYWDTILHHTVFQVLHCLVGSLVCAAVSVELSQAVQLAGTESLSGYIILAM